MMLLVDADWPFVSLRLNSSLMVLHDFLMQKPGLGINLIYTFVSKIRQTVFAFKEVLDERGFADNKPRF